jgi:hAT family C-terminal dimerisation region
MKGKKVSEPQKSELEDNWADALDEISLDDDFNILAWWKLKVPRYSILSRLTRDILAVPISTVTSESTFSTSGRTLNPVRSSLNDESLEALVCAQDWLRASVTGKFLETSFIHHFQFSTCSLTFFYYSLVFFRKRMRHW